MLLFAGEAGEVAVNTGGSGGPPALLSETGCFQVVAGGGTPTVGEPVADLVPFAPAAELWSATQPWLWSRVWTRRPTHHHEPLAK